jgi:hypothetical protein
LQQGDCKNAFCNVTLPEDELTVVQPPAGDPVNQKDEFWLLKKTLYGLRRSPHHWYNITPSPHDPCLFSGIVKSPRLTNLPPDADRRPIHIGLYVDDFVFFSEDPTEEDNFKPAMKDCTVLIDWMGTVDYFLETAFNWKRHGDGNLSVLLTQSAFVEYSAHRFAIDNLYPVPNMTPYRSGIPIDSIAPPDPKDQDHKRRTKCYQAIVGCINWLATCTRPDIAPALTFLASYSTNPSYQHYKSALHVLKYLYSTSDYGICFHSFSNPNIQVFNHFPHHHDKEAYSDAIPPAPADCHKLTAYSDACWGGQFGNAVPDGTPLNYLNIDPSPVILSVAQVVLSCGKQSDKIKQQAAPVSLKSMPHTSASTTSCPLNIVPLTLA